MEVSCLRHECFSDNKKPEVFSVFYKYLYGLKPQGNKRNFIWDILTLEIKVANQLFNCVLKNTNYQKDPEKAD